jgi:outer membrane protein OmpA-like peptidoglycan-associated protein
MGNRYKDIIFLVLLFSRIIAFAQEEEEPKVHWASEVLEVSSEKKLSHHIHHLYPNAYKAMQVLDGPNIIPGSEGSSHAWTPRKPNNIDFIKVKFNKPIHVKQIVIVEAINPSALRELYLYDTLGREYLIKTFNPKPILLTSRLLHIFIEKSPYSVIALKIVLNGKEVPGYNGIDAIGISESDVPVKIKPIIAEGYAYADQAEKLGDSINTEYKEIKPIFSPDGKRMYFSRINHPDNIGGHKDLEDIWFTDLDLNTGEWGAAQNAGAPLNNKGPNFICSITPKSYYYDVLLGNQYLKNNMKAGLSIATRSESGYSEPEPVIIDNYENLSPFANYFLVNGEHALLMSVHRKGGYGDRDLHVSFIQADGTWSTPLNLGDIINTTEIEASPFLSLDNKTLYFSSEGHLGYGEEDIFVTRRLDDTWTNWSEPENLGPSVNSAEDDIFFNLTPDQRYAYFSRGNKANTDIYKIELPLYLLPEPVLFIKGQVLNAVTKEPVPNALIQFRDTDSKQSVQQIRSDSTLGRYQVILPTGTNYNIFSYHDQLASNRDEHINAEYIFQTDTITKDILLYPVEDGRSISLNALLTGTITNGNTGKPIENAEIIFKDSRLNTLVKNITTANQTGQYEFDISIGNLYNINIQSEGYVSVENEILDLSMVYESDTIVRDFQLYPIELGQRISLDNIYFDFDKTELRSESQRQMNQVFQFLSNNPKVKVQFDGHTCSIGEANYNQKLSENRALSVYQDLLNKGISKKRISSFGFGESKPTKSNSTETARAQNRRVEFVIIEK